MDVLKTKMAGALDAEAAANGYSDRRAYADAQPESALRTIVDHVFDGNNEAAADYLADIIFPDEQASAG